MTVSIRINTVYLGCAIQTPLLRTLVRFNDHYCTHRDEDFESDFLQPL